MAVIPQKKSKAKFSRPEGAGNFDNMDDYNIVKSISVQEARVGAYKLPKTDGTNGQVLKTNGSGVATEQYNYLDITKPILVKIRKMSTDPEYEPFSTTGTITSSGFSLAATLDEDTIKT